MDSHKDLYEICEKFLDYHSFFFIAYSVEIFINYSRNSKNTEYLDLIEKSLYKLFQIYKTFYDLVSQIVLMIRNLLVN